MAFCTKCGNAVAEQDFFCLRCGARQRPGGPAASGTAGAGAGTTQPRDILDGLSPHHAMLACYVPVVGWIAAIVVLASSRFRDDREVRFHAFQGLYLFVVWLIVDWVLSPVFSHLPGPQLPFDKVVKLAVLFAWIFMLVKTAQRQSFRLPILGELAERSVAEQKS